MAFETKYTEIDLSYVIRVGLHDEVIRDLWCDLVVAPLNMILTIKNEVDLFLDAKLKLVHILIRIIKSIPI